MLERLLSVWIALAQVRQLDLDVAPWSGVMEAIRDRRPLVAEDRLERIAREHSGPAWQRAHAWRWAGQIAVREGDLARAERDFEAALRTEPDGFEARMSRVHLGEIAIRRRQWFRAERWLATVERDPDVLVRVYAVDRITAVRERTRRLAARYLSWAVVGAVLTWLAVRCLRVLRTTTSPLRSSRARSFGRALLLAETLAIASAMLLPRVRSPLATPGWMAFAVPTGILGAALWATRRDEAAWWKRGLAIAAFVLCSTAAMYLAYDYTWWAVERPIL